LGRSVFFPPWAFDSPTFSSFFPFPLAFAATGQIFPLVFLDGTPVHVGLCVFFFHIPPPYKHFFQRPFLLLNKAGPTTPPLLFFSRCFTPLSLITSGWLRPPGVSRLSDFFSFFFLSVRSSLEVHNLPFVTSFPGPPSPRSWGEVFFFDFFVIPLDFAAVVWPLGAPFRRAVASSLHFCPCPPLPLNWHPFLYFERSFSPFVYSAVS